MSAPPTAAFSTIPARGSPRQSATLPPALVLDGRAAPNGLSVARSLARRGVKVYAMCPYQGHLRSSRHVTWIELPDRKSDEDTLADFLLGPASDALAGAVLLPCWDPALMVVARHRDALLEKFRLDACHPPAQLAMLDKLATYRAAVAAGVPTPKFWVPHGRQHVLDLRDHLVYPLLVKPLLSHVYRSRFQTKFASVDSFDDLLRAYTQAEEAGIDVMLVEKIPGGDDRLCSYYTYMDEHGNALFDFTKRIIRRYPLTSGPACHHITDWVPELKEPALKLFRQVGLRGLANVEFKRDDRDGQLKLIECNARFTASNGLVAASGFDLARFVYNRVVGLPPEPLGPFKAGKRLLFPVEDFHAFCALRRQGQLTLGSWLASIAHPTTFPYFRWSDPWPTLVHEGRRFRDGLVRRLRALFRRG